MGSNSVEIPIKAIVDDALEKYSVEVSDEIELMMRMAFISMLNLSYIKLPNCEKYDILIEYVEKAISKFEGKEMVIVEDGVSQLLLNYTSLKNKIVLKDKLDCFEKIVAALVDEDTPKSFTHFLAELVLSMDEKSSRVIIPSTVSVLNNSYEFRSGFKKHLISCQMLKLLFIALRRNINLYFCDAISGDENGLSIQNFDTSIKSIIFKIEELYNLDETLYNIEDNETDIIYYIDEIIGEILMVIEKTKIQNYDEGQRGVLFALMPNNMYQKMFIVLSLKKD